MELEISEQLKKCSGLPDALIQTELAFIYSGIDAQSMIDWICDGQYNPMLVRKYLKFWNKQNNNNNAIKLEYSVLFEQYRDHFINKRFAFKRDDLKAMIKSIASDTDRDIFVDISTKISEHKNILLYGRATGKPLQIKFVYVTEKTQILLPLNSHMSQFGKCHLSTDEIMSKQINPTSARDCIRELFRQFKRVIDEESSIKNECIEQVTIVWQRSTVMELGQPRELDKGYIFVPKTKQLPTNKLLRKHSTSCWIENASGVIIPHTDYDDVALLSSNDRKIVMITYNCYSDRKIEEYLFFNGCVQRIRKKDFLEKTRHLFACKDLSKTTKDIFNNHYQSCSYSDNIYDKALKFFQSNQPKQNDIDKASIQLETTTTVPIVDQNGFKDDDFVAPNCTDSSSQHNPEIGIGLNCPLQEILPAKREHTNGSDDRLDLINRNVNAPKSAPQQVNNDMDDEMECEQKYHITHNEKRVINCVQKQFGADVLLNDYQEMHNIKLTKLIIKEMQKMYNGRSMNHNVYWNSSQTLSFWKCIIEKDEFTCKEDVYYYLSYTLKLQLLTRSAIECAFPGRSKFYIFNTELHYKKNGRVVYAVLVPNTFNGKKGVNWALKLLDFFTVKRSDSIDGYNAFPIYRNRLPEGSRSTKKYNDRYIGTPPWFGEETLRRQLEVETDLVELETEYWKVKIEGKHKNGKHSRSGKKENVYKKPINKYIGISEFIEQVCNRSECKYWIPILIFKKDKYWNDWIFGGELRTNEGDVIMAGIRYHFDKKEGRWVIISISTNIGDLINKWRLVGDHIDRDELCHLNEYKEKQKNIKLVITCDGGLEMGKKQTNSNVIMCDSEATIGEKYRKVKPLVYPEKQCPYETDCWHVRQGSCNLGHPPCRFKERCDHRGDCGRWHSRDDWRYFGGYAVGNHEGYVGNGGMYGGNGCYNNINNINASSNNITTTNTMGNQSNDLNLLVNDAMGDVSGNMVDNSMATNVMGSQGNNTMSAVFVNVGSDVNAYGGQQVDLNLLVNNADYAMGDVPGNVAIGNNVGDGAYTYVGEQGGNSMAGNVMRNEGNNLNFSVNNAMVPGNVGIGNNVGNCSIALLRSQTLQTLDFWSSELNRVALVQMQAPSYQAHQEYRRVYAQYQLQFNLCSLLHSTIGYTN